MVHPVEVSANNVVRMQRDTEWPRRIGNSRTDIHDHYSAGRTSKTPSSTAAEFIDLFQNEKNAWVWLEIVLKNNHTALE
jgi:hypothetical protein